MRRKDKTTIRTPSSRDRYLLQLAVIILVIAGAIGIALAVGGAKPKQTAQKPISACGPYRNDKTIHVNGAAIQTELPKTAADFAKGLGGRPCILPNQGMLFAFSKPGQYAFWMKDMKFPIDIIWIGADRKVAAEEIDLKPSTYPDRFVNKDHPAQYVLEIKANRSKELNIDLGTTVSF